MAVECEPVTVGRRVWRTGVKLKLFLGAASLVFLSTVCVCCVQSAVFTCHILDSNSIQVFTTAPCPPCTCPPWNHLNTVGLLPLQHAQLVPTSSTRHWSTSTRWGWRASMSAYLRSRWSYSTGTPADNLIDKYICSMKMSMNCGVTVIIKVPW